ncbi:amino acid ABC transporter ATP-binding protein [Acidaminococcus fermentans]|uniref:amino acid ABC transporter ATP-binding protein n=1 Tax=Acidaminococcus fermentans TaxID=905 RepID=UPI0009439F33
MLQLQHLNKYFGKQHILKDVDLTVHENEVVSIIGPSGAGKSTLLRCVNYLEKPESGSYAFDEVTFDAAHVKKRDICYMRQNTAMVFQQFNLFNEMTVKENVEFGLLKVKHMKPEQAAAISRELLAKVGMEERADYYPAQLSGGQQQRAAIARAVALDPKIILFDEPTSALDPEMIGKVLDVIRMLAGEGRTMIIVSHEMNFVRKISDQVVFMSDGAVVETGTAQELFENPKEPRTKQFFETLHY